MDKNQEDQQEETKVNEREENLKKLKNVKNKNFITALHHSVDGIIKAFKTERNLRIDYLCAACVLLAGVVLGLNKTEFVCLCLTVGFVIFSEMMNSVAEYIVDLVTDKYDDRAKAAKDIAAGGVLISSSISVIVAYFLFADKLKNATTNVISTIFSCLLRNITIRIARIKRFLSLSRKLLKQALSCAARNNLSKTSLQA